MSGSRSEVLIIGAGIAGCSLAYYLAERGVGVTLLDEGERQPQGASAVAAALLNPYRGRSGKPGRYDLDGLAAFWRLTDELRSGGREAGAHRSGVLRIASSERQARSWEALPGLQRLEKLPPPYRAPNGAFLVTEGGWVEPARLIGGLLSAAAENGATVVRPVRVERVERTAGRWVANAAGGDFSAPHLALCLGAGEVEGVRLPQLERIAGDQVTLLSDVELPWPIAGPVYLTGSGGRVFVGGNHRSPEAADPHAPELLRASAARMVPPLADATVERVWTGVRAKRSDNLPLLAELEPGLWYLGAFGGRGFLTAPLLAGRLARRLAGG